MTVIYVVNALPYTSLPFTLTEAAVTVLLNTALVKKELSEPSGGHINEWSPT